MKKPVATIKTKLPENLAKDVHNRISVFLDLYNDEQRIQTIFFDRPIVNQFDIKSLAYSCYLQGLADAKEALNNKN